MDAKEFISERNRMCKSFGDDNCCGCTLNPMLGCSDLEKFTPEMVDAVEKWSKEHPKTTNRDKLKEVFGYVSFSIHECYHRININDLPIQIWLDQEYKEPEVKK